MSTRPSLRIRQFTVKNYRLFRDPVTFDLADGDGPADGIVVFHGDNGAGKSTALSALQLFFSGAAYFFANNEDAKDKAHHRRAAMDGYSGFGPVDRDWPFGVLDPIEVEVTFEDNTLGTMRLAVILSGPEHKVRLQRIMDGREQPIAADLRNLLATLFSTPSGGESRPWVRFDPRRRESAVPRRDEASNFESPVTDLMARNLLSLLGSFDGLDRDRWRAFVRDVTSFETLSGLEVDMFMNDVRFERRGQLVLRHSELSSGEQQVAALVAAGLTARASIIAIEEPELSLSPRNQNQLRQILQNQIDDGLVDQFFLETHSPAFDGPRVVRLARKGDKVDVARTASETPAPGLKEKAVEQGGDIQWVTQEGYTKLPPRMIEEMGVPAGGFLCFLPDDDGRWQAWRASELDEEFGIGSADRDE